MGRSSCCMPSSAARSSEGLGGRGARARELSLCWTRRGASAPSWHAPADRSRAPGRSFHAPRGTAAAWRQPPAAIFGVPLARAAGARSSTPERGSIPLLLQRDAGLGRPPPPCTGKALALTHGCHAPPPGTASWRPSSASSITLPRASCSGSFPRRSCVSPAAAPWLPPVAATGTAGAR